MLRREIKNFFAAAVPECDRGEFTDGINRINIFRAKITALMFILLEVMLMTFWLVFRRIAIFRAPGICYIGMYGLLIVLMLIFYPFFCRFGKDVSRYRVPIHVLGVCFISLILLWCGGISLLDQMSANQIMVYVFALMAVAVTPFFKPVVMLAVYLSVQTVFIVFLIFLRHSFGIPFGNILNSTTFMIVSLVVSSLRYRQKVQEFKTEKLMKNKNAELKRINTELQEANRQLEELARLDGLTGIFNRTVFNRTIELEWLRCRRQFKPLSLLMIDIDYFKNYNDQYGHRAGDDCIRKIAGVLSACARRASDTVARYGGEEFAVILPYTEKEDARALAEQMRQKIEALAISQAVSCPLPYVTISCGVQTVLPTDGRSMEDLIEMADKALYSAKNGRNTVVVA